MTILRKITSYYDDKVSRHGPTAKGVDWNSEQSQNIRFSQLCKVITNPKFSLIDYGCGYGALYQYLLALNLQPSMFYGYDTSEIMIKVAERLYGNREGLCFSMALPEKPCDYTIASGVFNVRLDVNLADWEEYIKESLVTLDKYSIRGFAFNLLTSYADKHLMKDYLYYANPSFYFDLCKHLFSRNVSMLHDYDLYEFTIIVRK